MNRSLDSDRATAFAEEATAQELNMGTVDANEGVAAFVERRSPTYRGWQPTPPNGLSCLLGSALESSPARSGVV